MQFFILKPKTKSFFFSPTHPFMRSIIYLKNWQNHEMGQKKSIFEIGTENTPCDISNALYFITDQKSHTKMKIWGFMCPQGLKIWSQNTFGVLKPFFWSQRAQMASNFRFCSWFLISDKIQSVWYIIGRIFCAISKIDFFTLFYNIASLYVVRSCA